MLTGLITNCTFKIFFIEKTPFSGHKSDYLCTDLDIFIKPDHLQLNQNLYQKNLVEDAKFKFHGERLFR